MRLKEINPGMVIHCKNDEEKKALLEEAERLGYCWLCSEKLPTEKVYEGNTIHFYAESEFADFKHITWSDKTEGVTEFSDLILPELTAEEVLVITNEICSTYSDEMIDCNTKCPFYHSIFCKKWMAKHPKEAVEICAQWKSDHEKKEPEIEWVYRVFGAENYGEKFFQTEEEAIKRCEELAKSQKTKQYARYERVCRVKEV